jgi:hypothetical protein
MITKLDNAISYFAKKNQNPSGTLTKIYAYEIAERGLKDIQAIKYILSEVMQETISDNNALKKIKEIINK